MMEFLCWMLPILQLKVPYISLDEFTLLGILECKIKIVGKENIVQTRLWLNKQWYSKSDQ